MLKLLKTFSRILLLISIIRSVVYGKYTENGNSVNFESENENFSVELDEIGNENRRFPRPQISGLPTRRPLLIHRIVDIIKKRRHATTEAVSATPFNRSTTKIFIKNRTTSTIGE
jgi:hypothetical protein